MDQTFAGGKTSGVAPTPDVEEPAASEATPSSNFEYPRLTCPQQHPSLPNFVRKLFLTFFFGLLYHKIMTTITLEKIEKEIKDSTPQIQRRLLEHLPTLFKYSASDLSLLKLAGKSFDFWNNTDDAVYDRL